MKVIALLQAAVLTKPASYVTEPVLPSIAEMFSPSVPCVAATRGRVRVVSPA
jgi:hypothetical protein